MNKLSFFFLIAGIFSVTSCAKEELSAPKIQDGGNGTSIDLRSAECTPGQSDYEYSDSYFINYVGVDCIPELISNANFTTHQKGKWVLSASCHLNDKGAEEVTMTGIGVATGHIYSLHAVQDYHINLNFSGQVESAAVFHGFDNLVITDETTGETYSGLKLKMHVTFNANGEPVAGNFDFIECN
ncbi:MAG: hypothetical protein EP344_15330 [Bacteroidetes bacterium]|nr:MAG: hypothetical protein EP344_15330 [Bacteroidota bacterium]